MLFGCLGACFDVIQYRRQLRDNNRFVAVLAHVEEIGQLRSYVIQ